VNASLRLRSAFARGCQDAIDITRWRRRLSRKADDTQHPCEEVTTNPVQLEVATAATRLRVLHNTSPADTRSCSVKRLRGGVVFRPEGACFLGPGQQPGERVKKLEALKGRPSEARKVASSGRRPHTPTQRFNRATRSDTFDKCGYDAELLDAPIRFGPGFDRPKMKTALIRQAHSETTRRPPS
jgi:hypothetical protein